MAVFICNFCFSFREENKSLRKGWVNRTALVVERKEQLRERLAKFQALVVGRESEEVDSCHLQGAPTATDVEPPPLQTISNHPLTANQSNLHYIDGKKYRPRLLLLKIYPFFVKFYSSLIKAFQQNSFCPFFWILNRNSNFYSYQKS